MGLGPGRGRGVASRCESMAQSPPTLPPLPHQKEIPLSLSFPEMAKLADLPNRKFPEEILKIQPIGARIIVLREPKIDKYGEIYIPDHAKPEMNTGWIVGVGPSAAVQLEIEEDPGVSLGKPSRLIGQKVMWGRWMGAGLPVYPHEKEFECLFVMMQAEELWAFQSP